MKTEIKYLRVNQKHLKKHGTIINGELHLNEGVFTKFDPNVNQPYKTIFKS